MPDRLVAEPTANGPRPPPKQCGGCRLAKRRPDPLAPARHLVITRMGWVGELPAVRCAVSARPGNQLRAMVREEVDLIVGVLKK